MRSLWRGCLFAAALGSAAVVAVMSCGRGGPAQVRGEVSDAVAVQGLDTLLADLRLIARENARDYQAIVRMAARTTWLDCWHRDWGTIRASLERQGAQLVRDSAGSFERWHCVVQPGAFKATSGPPHDLVLYFDCFDPPPVAGVSRHAVSASERVATPRACLVARWDMALDEVARSGAYENNSALDKWLRDPGVRALADRFPFLHEVSIHYGPYQPISPEYANVGFRIDSEFTPQGGGYWTGARAFHTIACGLDPAPTWGRPATWLDSRKGFVPRMTLGEVESWGGNEWTRTVELDSPHRSPPESPAP